VYIDQALAVIQFGWGMPLLIVSMMAVFAIGLMSGIDRVNNHERSARQQNFGNLLMIILLCLIFIVETARQSDSLKKVQESIKSQVK
jgi:hypothetical protein